MLRGIHLASSNCCDPSFKFCHHPQIAMLFCQGFRYHYSEVFNWFINNPSPPLSSSFSDLIVMKINVSWLLFVTEQLANNSNWVTVQELSSCMQIILSCFCIKQIFLCVFLPINCASQRSVINDLPIVSRVFKIMSSNLIDNLSWYLFFMKSMSTTMLSSYFSCKYNL